MEMRITALEATLSGQGKTFLQHVEGCERKAEKNEADNAKIIRTQADQGAVLSELQEVLPWLKQNYKDKKARDEAWRAVGQFMAGMARKNWDSVSGKLIFFVIAGFLAWRGLPWQKVVSLVFGG